MYSYSLSQFDDKGTVQGSDIIGIDHSHISHSPGDGRKCFDPWQYVHVKHAT